jgi:hypothetical protein
MAHEIGTTAVIDDSRRLQNITGADGVYSDLSPNVTQITNTINFDFPVMSCDMTENLTFGATNIPTSADDTRISMLLLNRSADLHSLSFANVSGGIIWTTEDNQEPTWSDYQYWQVVFTASSDRITAAAGGFVDVSGGGGGTAEMSTNISVPIAWLNRLTQIEETTSGFPSAFISIRFLHEPNDNRIAITWVGGRSTETISQTTNVTTYVNYSGITNITDLDVQYNVSDQDIQTGGSQTFNCTPADPSTLQTPSDLRTTGIHNPGVDYNLLGSTAGVYLIWHGQGRGADAINGLGGTLGYSYAIFPNPLDNPVPHLKITMVCDQGTFIATAALPTRPDNVPPTSASIYQAGTGTGESGFN